MKKYYVTYAVFGRYDVEVEADSIEEARKKADDEWCDSDFGDLRDIDGEPVIIETEEDGIVWEN